MIYRLVPGLAALLALTLGETGQVTAQVQLASRAPRFVRISPVTRRLVDASHATILKREMSVNLDRSSLVEALDEISRTAGIRLIYSRDMVPREMPVTLRAAAISVGAALTAVLFDTGLDVVISSNGEMALMKKAPISPLARGPSGSVSGRVTDARTGAVLVGATVVADGVRQIATTDADGHYRIADVAPGTYTVRVRYIGYAPESVSVAVTAEREATADFALEKSVQRLDEVVTTGTVVPTEVKALPTPISVVTGSEIEAKGYRRVDQIFRGDVPGSVAWDVGAPATHSEIMVRGASSLAGGMTIKTLVDGVEVADPQFVATIDPSSVDRIEITRGPQASTVYGSGALNGVMQIFTKKGELGLTRPQITGNVSAGGIGGFDGAGTALQTDNSAAVLGGTEKTSYSLGGSYRHTGAWAPSSSSTNWGLSAGGQSSQGPLTVSGSARYADNTFDDPWDTRLRAISLWSQPLYRTFRVLQQTYGLTGSLRATQSWQHTLTLGYDHTYYSYYSTRPRFTTPADSFLSLNAEHTSKISLLYHTDLSLRLARAATATVTAGVNYDAFDYLQSFTSGATVTTGSVDGSSSVSRTPWTSTGYFGQAQLALAERLYLTAGLRAERNANFGADVGTAWSPRAGASYVLGVGAARVKLRASYGESIRAPDPTQRIANTTEFAIQVANPSLGPERQRGGDGGIDVYVGRASFSATYYNQRAINLIDQVTVPTPAGASLPALQYQNVARVKNEGWEFEGRLPLGRLQLGGNYSITHSTVQELPPDFPQGDLQVGDQITGVPRSSAGATITYSPLRHTTLTASMTHIGHWSDSDFIALFSSLFNGDPPYRGSSRAYWIEYPTVTKFAVGVTQTLRDGLAVYARAENVGNNLRSEHFNAGNIPMPRSVVVGATVRY
jgi:outer membrane receptor protein involved in Fe transport